LYYRNDDPNGAPNPERLKMRADTLHAIEEGNNSIAELADYVATRNVECILDTMERLGIRYDVMPRESEILHLHFWDKAFERMKESGAIQFQNEGRNKGCWVMPSGTHTGTDEHEADKIIVRSNGTVTYTGKDIAYQLWKLGLLGLDFNYRLFRTYTDGQKTWMTTAEPQPGSQDQTERPRFGGGAIVYNVIDSRQSYTQDVVRAGVAALAPEVGEHASVHLAYEMVALTPSACEELGIVLSDEDRTRSHIEMSGRKGLGVKADDLINRLELNALAEVETRHPELSDEERKQTAHAIAVGALRYFLLKFTRTTVIGFDFKEALSFEGETGPYCQYAAVRANSIFRKLDADALSAARDIIEKAGNEDGVERDNVTAVLDGEIGDEIWSLAVLAGRFDDTISQAASQAEPATLARYTFNLARAFNLFYHRHRIIAEENVTKRAVLVAVADITRRQLTNALATLGIDVPERM
jgi:arginyl-tRNA synthetase